MFRGSMYWLIWLLQLIVHNRCYVTSSSVDTDDNIKSNNNMEEKEEEKHPPSCLNDDKSDGSSSTTCRSSTKEEKTHHDQQEEQQCGLYLAPSTIPNAGIGVFTTKDLNVGDLIGYEDIAIPIYDITWHYLNQSRSDNDRSWSDNDYFWLLSNYVWKGSVMGMNYEASIGTKSDGNDVSAFCPGLDAAVNCNLALLNVDRGMPQYDVGGLHRSTDPGVGSYSPYYNTPSVTKHFVPMGGELFKNYGSSWFETRTSMFDPSTFPLTYHYKEAEQIIEKFVLEFQPTIERRQQREEENNENPDIEKRSKNTDTMMNDLWNVITDFPYISPTIHALPSTLKEAHSVAHHEDGIRILHQPSATRSPEELKENGRCIDNIKVGNSTLPQAVRGAFATRYLRKDSIITGSPIIQIPNGEELLKVRDVILDENGMHHMLPDIVSMQLLYNYCFGHAQSSLLLCPYGSGVNYMNHNQSQANVRIQWSPHGILSQNDEWLDIDLTNSTQKKSMEVYSAQLAVDYVALRDIQPNEELFLDYGTEWEDAWQSHVTRYRPPLSSWAYSTLQHGDEEQYTPASVWNKQKEILKLYTTKEQETLQPYPSNIRLACHPNMELCDAPNDRECSITEWQVHDIGVECTILNRYQVNNDKSSLASSSKPQQRQQYLYNVQIPVNASASRRWEKVTNESLKFEDMPYSTDMHLKEAFRHKLMIPDDMFPPKWKDLK